MRPAIRLLAALILLFPCGLIAQHVHSTFGDESASLVKFTENKNQWDNKIKYRAFLDGGSLWIQDGRFTYGFYDKDTYRSLHANPNAPVPEKGIRATGFDVILVNANKDASFEASDATPDYNNYFIGKDRTKWASHVHNYRRLFYKQVWNGIDMELLGRKGSIKYNFYVKAGADPSVIKLQYSKVEKIRLEKNTVRIKTSINELVEFEPFAYQEIDGIKAEVHCRFTLKNNTIGYEFPEGYNTKYDLVIDPVLVFACSSGSIADNFGMTATYDSLGNLYSGGTCFDQGFPVVNAYDGTYNSIVQYGQTDVVITKYDSAGAFLHYSTYLGGSDDAEVVNSLIVDNQNNLYLLGVTASTDYPVTAGAYDQTFNGGKRVRFYYNGAFFENGTDICISKLSANGTTLLASTFVGGTKNDGLNYTVDSSFVGNVIPYGAVYQPNYDSLFFNYGDQNRGEIQLDNAGDILIATSTRSSDFPVVSGFDATLDGTQDAVVFKLNSSLTSLQWSTYLGGSNMDAGFALYPDAQNNVFVTGGTASSNFPGTSGAYQAVYGGGKADGYIAKIKFDGTQLLHSTFLGTTSYDQTFFVQLDANANAYVFGQTQGTVSVVNAAYFNNNGRQFVAKLDSTLGTLLMRTKIGNGVSQINISPSAFLVDCSENIYMSGWGGNILTSQLTNNMPITPGAIQSTTDGRNFYLMVLSKNAQSLLHGTYFGGAQSSEHVDGGTSRFDRRGIIYQSVCAGCGGNDDFPVTPGAWPTSLYGADINQSSNCNNGTFKIDFDFDLPTSIFTTSSVSGCAPLTVNFTNTSVSYDDFLWDFGNGDTSTVITNPIVTYPNPGTYTVTLTALNNACYSTFDTAITIITVYPQPLPDFGFTFDACTNNYAFSDSSSSSITQWNWNFGDSNTSNLQNPSHTYSPGTYSVSLIVTNSNGCKDTIVQPITVSSFGPASVSSAAICAGDSASLLASGGVSYQWSPATGLSNPNSANPVASPSVTTQYTVSITQVNANNDTCVTPYFSTVTVVPVPQAQFTITNSPCSSTFTFNDNSTGAISSWNWNFGTGDTSSTQTPSYTFDSSGTYNITLIVSNAQGCSDTITQPVSATVFNPVSVNSDTSICSGGSAQLSAGGGISYQWTPATGLSNANSANPIASPAVTTTYTVSVTQIANNDTCTSSLVTTVNVVPVPQAAFSASSSACSSTFNFTDNSTGSILTWDWNFGDSNTSAIQNPVHTFGSSGTYTVTLIAANSLGCADTATQPLTLLVFPPATVTADTVLCPGESVQLNATGGVLYQWSPATGLSNSAISNPVASPSVTTQYSVSIIQVTGTDTCISTLTTNIVVSAYPSSSLIATATPTVITQGDTSQLGTLTTGGSITWYPPYNLSDPNSQNPTATPLHTTTYTAMYTDANGCKFPLSPVTIEVLAKFCEESTVFVPNTFTPNNDGNNDILYARSGVVSEIYFAIYDRWGMLVFETNDLSKGWDGIFNGKECNPDVFGYYIKFKCTGGKESFKKGNITLIR